MEIRNKVAESGIITLNLEDYLPNEEIVVFDIKDYLFRGLILKEKDFRETLKQLSTEPYRSRIVAITCSTDAIIPMWAYMLIVTLLQPYAGEIYFGDASTVRQKMLLEQIESLSVGAFQEARVVVKGCGDAFIDETAYIAITKKLLPVVKSLMYGEPCSTVPIYKKKL